MKESERWRIRHRRVPRGHHREQVGKEAAFLSEVALGLACWSEGIRGRGDLGLACICHYKVGPLKYVP